MSSRKELENLITEISEISGFPTTKEQAMEKHQDKYLVLDYSSTHGGGGGYRLFKQSIETGGLSDAFGFNISPVRRKAKEMHIFLTGLLAGLQFNKGR